MSCERCYDGGVAYDENGRKVWCECPAGKRAKLAHRLKRHAATGTPPVLASFPLCRLNAERRAVLRTFAAAPPGTSAVLYGSVGTGKSVLAQAMLRARMTNLMRSDPTAPPGLFVVVPDLFRSLELSFSGAQASSLGYELFERAKRAPVVVLDDALTGKASRYRAQELYALVNHRYNYELSTLVTFNVPQGTAPFAAIEQYLAADGPEHGMAVASRLAAMTPPDFRLRFYGDDLRLAQRARAF